MIGAGSIFVEGLGIATEHATDLVVDRAHGLPNLWLVMCFSSPFWFSGSGDRIEGAPGNCIIHAPLEPHSHGSLPGSTTGFRNDWIHVGGEGMARIVQECNLRTSSLLPTKSSHKIAPFLERIRRETYRRDVCWQAAVRLEVEAMLIDIARGMFACPLDSDTLLEREMRERLTDLRVRVHESLDHIWTVEEMAAQVHVSPSRFHGLYKQFFNISPIEDLIEQRINHAKWLLSSTSISVAKAAALSGFSSLFYFSRTFRQRTGLSPTEFARRHTT